MANCSVREGADRKWTSPVHCSELLGRTGFSCCRANQNPRKRTSTGSVMGHGETSTVSHRTAPPVPPSCASCGRHPVWVRYATRRSPKAHPIVRQAAAPLLGLRSYRVDPCVPYARGSCCPLPWPGQRRHAAELENDADRSVLYQDRQGGPLPRQRARSLGQIQSGDLQTLPVFVVGGARSRRLRWITKAGCSSHR